MIASNTSDLRKAGRASSRPARSVAPSFWTRVRKAPLHDYPIRDEILNQYLTILAGADVLEIGPGTGFTAFCLAHTMRQVTLVDIARDNVEDLRQQLGTLANVRCVWADTTEPGLDGKLRERFDVAFGLDVFEHVANPAMCLRNLAACLRPGGRLLLTYPNFAPPAGNGVTYFSRIEEIDTLLSEAGFESWEVFTVHLNAYAQKIYGLFHELPLRLYRFLRNGAGEARPQIYEATWAFQNRARLREHRAILHLYWEFLNRLLRFGGSMFSKMDMTGGILSRQLVIYARR